MPKHMAWSLTGDLILTVHDEGPPADDEWRAWLRDFEGAAPSLRGNVVYSLGGGPTSSQRKDLLNAIARLQRVPPTVILTSSALMRGLVTAIGWFLTADRRPTMFSLDEMGPALDSLSIDADARTAARAEIERLRASLAARPKAVVSGRA
jgi:hypothetical protein